MCSLAASRMKCLCNSILSEKSTLFPIFVNHMTFAHFFTTQQHKAKFSHSIRKKKKEICGIVPSCGLSLNPIILCKVKSHP